MYLNRGILCATPAIILWLTGAALADATVQGDDAKAGQALYEQRCSVCHDHPQDRIPPKTQLGSRNHDYIVRTLTTGPMQGQAAGLSMAQIDSLAAYLIEDMKSSTPAGVRAVSLDDPALRANLCKMPAPHFTLSSANWNGFSPDAANTRFQRRPGLSTADVPKLKPRWVFAYPGTGAYGPPSAVAGRVFVGTASGSVLSLDAKTGCTYWATEPGAAVRTPVSIGEWSAAPEGNGARAHFVVYFGDGKAIVHAVNAETGEALWWTKVDEHALAGISGAPTLHDGKLYVPLTSNEGSMGPRGDYSCCTFRGSVAALDAYTGKIIWKGYTITEEPKPFKLNSAGTQMYAPAGVGIWSALTVDVKRARVYGTTAESKTGVSVDSSDAILAFDWNTGARLWVTQPTPNDNWIQGCEGQVPGPNCPDPLGTDADFDTPAMILNVAHGKQILVAAQKSGLITSVDPDSGGRIVWQRNLAREAQVPAGVVLRDHMLPGIVYGMAADDSKVYAAIADPGAEKGHIPLGVYALDSTDGSIVWHTSGPAVPSCSWGIADAPVHNTRR